MLFKYAFQTLFKCFPMGLKCFYMCFLQRFFQALLKTPLKRFETFGSNAFKHILQTLFERRFLTHLITLFQLIPGCFLKTFFKTLFTMRFCQKTLLKGFIFKMSFSKRFSKILRHMLSQCFCKRFVRTL